MSTFFSTLRSLARDRRGAAVVETAIGLPVLLTMAFAFIDLTQGFAYRMTMQQNAQVGADFVTAAGKTVPSDTAIKSEIVKATGLDSSAITINRHFDCNGLRAATQAVGCPAVLDLRVNYMTITVKGNYDPVLKIKHIADFMPKTEVVESATIRLPKT